MIHRTVRIYDERTGDPMVDNRNRNANRALNRLCRDSLSITTTYGRRRKHVATRDIYAGWVELVADVAENMARE